MLTFVYKCASMRVTEDVRKSVHVDTSKRKPRDGALGVFFIELG